MAQKWGAVAALHATAARQVQWEASRAREVCRLCVVVRKQSTCAFSGGV